MQRSRKSAVLPHLGWHHHHGPHCYWLPSALGTLPLGQPKWQIWSIISPHFPLQSPFTAAKEPSQQVQGCWATAQCVAGGMHLTATQRKEKTYRKNQTSARKGEAPALPELLGGPCLGLAACRTWIRPWLAAQSGFARTGWKSAQGVVQHDYS